MKKLLNKPENIMDETIEGYAAANRKRLYLVPGTHQMVRKEKKEKGKVKLVVGNGGGHEPCLLGWIGKGMYDMDCLGEVFTAQSGAKFFEGIQALDDGSPILITIANHEGDVINGKQAFKLAKEAGMQVMSVLFYDDVASAPKGMEEERRGVAGIMFSIKTAGAAAEEGACLEECVRIFEKARDNTRTFAIALTSCTHPMTGLTMMDVPDGEIELGGGIHGEGGMDTVSFMHSMDICSIICDKILEDKPYQEGEEVVMLVNGSGATSMMEMSIFSRDVERYLKGKGISVYDAVAGNFITTQELGGLSLSLLSVDKELKRLWDAPCSTPSYCNLT